MLFDMVISVAQQMHMGNKKKTFSDLSFRVSIINYNSEFKLK